MNQHIAMSVFVAVAKAEGFSPAARKLGMSTTAVSRHVADLEQLLGVTLLRRTTRRISLTEEGAGYLPRAAAVLEEIKRLHEEVAEAGSAPRGKLRITAAPAIGKVWIAPLAIDFAESYPAIEIELDLSGRLVDLVAEGFDAAIRAGPMPGSSLIAHRLAGIDYVACASPRYLERRGMPSRPEDLSDHDCIHWRSSDGSSEWTFTRRGTPVSVAIRGRFLINDFAVEREAAVRGIGLAVLPLLSVRDDLDAGRLVRVLPDCEIESEVLSLVRPPTPFEAPKLRAFIDFVTAALRTRARRQ